MKAVNCQLQAVELAPDKALTVGDLLSLSCDGDMGGELKPNAQFVFQDEKDKYKLHALELVESSSNHIKLIVTSYRPGDYTSESLILSDGESAIQTNELSWSVSSVLSQSEEPKPAPSKGPLELSYPLWFWFSLAAVFVSLTALIYFILNRRQKRKKLREELLQYKTMLSPFAQFSKDVRQTQKQIPAAKTNEQFASITEKIENDFRLYLIRELVVPALQVNDKDLLREIKRASPKLYEQRSASLRKILHEFAKTKDASKQVDERDVEGLLILSRRTAEKIMSDGRRQA